MAGLTCGGRSRRRISNSPMKLVMMSRELPVHPLSKLPTPVPAEGEVVGVEEGAADDDDAATLSIS